MYSIYIGLFLYVKHRMESAGKKKSVQSILGHSGFRSKYTLSQNCILSDSQTLPFKYMSVIERLPPSNTLTSPPDSGNQDLNKACNLRT